MGDLCRFYRLVAGRQFLPCGALCRLDRARSEARQGKDLRREACRIDSLITHTMPQEDINKGFELMKSGESIRAVVEF